ncbi:hypothetical protein PtA15_2A221 [Puccinia triticina]|uniref:Myb/SANT-like domain-containing protein n=1 Tax=Puccinia triticina TaxID=208348 RepID=A0ABY7C9Q0_9BASI|nr:uncharacterized protein PtA15_2A221 [Puccinia triticina]WAQ81908.1 hypothetical protein PtA15_2A221 [Puccinia triticina]
MARHGSTANGFKPASWNQVAQALQGSELVNGLRAKDKDTCKSRWQALKKLYVSFQTVARMLGAGWDETSKMVNLPPLVWKDLAENKSLAGRDLSQWEHQSLSLYHKLGELIEGNVATGELMETTEDGPAKTQRDVGNVIEDVEGDIDDKDDASDQDLAVIRGPVPTITPTAKRKQGSGMSPEVLVNKLKLMGSSMASR